MKANIQTSYGLKRIEILKAPFRVNDIWLFVHRDMGAYSITEWQTGIRFTFAEYKSEIRQSINNIFEKILLKRIKEVIQENIKKHGMANEGIPEDMNKSGEKGE